MGGSARNSLLLFLFLVPFLAASDEPQKAHKIVNKVTAMALDPSAKRSVSLTISQSLSVSRAELAQRRRAMNLNYGDLFIAYQLVKNGTKMDDIAAKMKMGKTVWQAADEQHVDWKQIISEAKKVNGRLDANLLGHFSNSKSEVERDRADGYDPFLDTVGADNDVSQTEVEDAQKRYSFLRDHAGVVSDGILDTSTEKSARMVRTDPVRTGGPKSIGVTAPPNK